MNHPFEEVYHCSPVQGLTLITPRVSTHGRGWVYATGDVVMSSVFLGREGGDFTCATGTLDGAPYIVERFQGAIERRYGGIRGSLYTLPGRGFTAGRTTWSHDLVSEEAVAPLHETRVDDAKDYLLRLAAEGLLTVKFYPDRFAGMPDDDEDLVEMAAVWNNMDRLRKYHPGLVDRTLEAIASGKYGAAETGL